MTEVREGDFEGTPPRVPLLDRGGPSTSWLGLELSGGRYHVNDMLGEGGPSIVYRAYDRNLGVDVAIEVPRRPSLVDPAFSARFLRAVRTLAQQTHPHLVKITDTGMHGEAPFAVAEYLPGGSLKSRRRVGLDGLPAPMDPESLAAWLPDVAGTLDFLHAQGQAHRDVRPANILFDAQGKVYLGGLGMSAGVAESIETAPGRLPAEAGMTSGSPGYMAPEQIMGQAADGRADQYALAVIVYEWLSGRRPFDGPTATAVLVQQATQEPPALHQVCPTVSEPLSAVVHRGLSRDPESRFSDCIAFARAVLAAARGEAVIQSRPEPAATPSRAARAVAERSAADTGTEPDVPQNQRHWLAVVCSATIAAACVLGPRRAAAMSSLWPLPIPGRTASLRALKVLGPPSRTTATVPALLRDVPSSLDEPTPPGTPAEAPRRVSTSPHDSEPSTQAPAFSQWWLGPITPPRSLRRLREARCRARSSRRRNVHESSRPANRSGIY